MKYGRLTVIKQLTFKRGGGQMLLICDCGKERIAPLSILKSGGLKSCGCLNRDKIIERNTTHNKSGTVVYRRWHAMHDRCRHNEGYIKRGITVCERWALFENFYEDMSDPPIGMSLDRINNDLGYYKENCRWATTTEQNNNTTQNVYLLVNGETKTLTQWAVIYNLPPKRLRDRIMKLGWDVERALTT